MGPDALLVVPAYLLGTFPTAQLVAGRAGHDPLREGSGNPGASNVYRLAGRRAAAAVFLGDLAKGTAAALGGLAVAGRPLGIACGAAAVLGHMFPVTRRLRGGKGVATGAGLALVMFPVPSAGVAVVWLVLARGLGQAAPASIGAAVGFPVLVAAIGRPAWEITVVIGLALLVIARHRDNIARLLRGEERPLEAPSRADGERAS